MSDLRSWDNEVVKQYAIPNNYLLDPEERITEKNIEELEKPYPEF